MVDFHFRVVVVKPNKECRDGCSKYAEVLIHVGNANVSQRPLVSMPREVYHSTVDITLNPLCVYMCVHLFPDLCLLVYF